MKSSQYSVAIAPMEGVSDFPYRLWLHLISRPELNCTPFYRVTESCVNKEIPVNWLPEKMCPGISLGYKTLPQLMGDSTHVINAVAKKLEPHVDFIDVNFGCPSKKVVGHGSGSSLLKDINYFEKFIEELCTSGIKYSIKIRTGFEDDTKFAKMIDIIAKFPLKQLTVHGRTKEQAYKGQADWNLIKYASENLTIPVIGSGDVIDLESFRCRIEIAPKISGVIIGRAVTRNPWIFQELRENAPVEIDLAIISHVLATFAVLGDLFVNNFSKLVDLVNKGFFALTLGNSLEKWIEFSDTLHREIYNSEFDINNIQNDLRGLGRIKLVWHNLRTSLPKEFFEPTLLRSKSMVELVSKIEGIKLFYQNTYKTTKVHLKPNLDYNWLFSGESKTHC